MVTAGGSGTGKTVVISQPMYFPWFGIFEQMRLADVFIHYDDVQFARGFYNRVQVKTPQGTCMITVPLRDKHRGQKIDESLISYETDWASHHRAVLISSYQRARHLDDAVSIFDEVTGKQHERLSDLGRDSIMAIAAYLGLTRNREFSSSSELGIAGSSSQRLVDISKAFAAETYVTGHGALNYLDHELFEANAVNVRYMQYDIREYEQVFPPFTPYVTALDLIAHEGSAAADLFNSSTLEWRSALERSRELRP